MRRKRGKGDSEKNAYFLGQIYCDKQLGPLMPLSQEKKNEGVYIF